MSKKTKQFDCLAMKDEIQAKLYEERQRLGDQEQIRRMRHRLATSDDPLSKWFRAVSRKNTNAGDEAKAS